MREMRTYGKKMQKDAKSSNWSANASLHEFISSSFVQIFICISALLYRISLKHSARYQTRNPVLSLFYLCKTPVNLALTGVVIKSDCSQSVCLVLHKSFPHAAAAQVIHALRQILYVDSGRTFGLGLQDLLPVSVVNFYGLAQHISATLHGQ